MRRSKIEMYTDVLSALALEGPLKLTHIMYKVNVNCKALKEFLEFLIRQGLVEERSVGKRRVVYAATQRGLTLLQCFKELREALPIVEDQQQVPSLF